ncbi:unnamed protein product, partial [Lampetra fluviatilis]
EQYEFLYRCLLEFHTCGDTEMSVAELRDKKLTNSLTTNSSPLDDDDDALATEFAGYEGVGVFVVTQSPSEGAVSDFWHLVVQLRVTQIVCLSNGRREVTQLQCAAKRLLSSPQLLCTLAEELGGAQGTPPILVHCA